MTRKRMLTFCLLLFVAVTLQSQQPDKPMPVDSIPDTNQIERSIEPVDSTAILSKKLETEIKKTAETSERINKKVAKIPPMIDRALSTVRGSKKVNIDVQELEPTKPVPKYPEVSPDSVIKKKSSRRFLKFLKKKNK